MSLFSIGQEIRLPIYSSVKYKIIGRTASGYLILAPLMEPTRGGEDQLDMALSWPNKIYYLEDHLEAVITNNKKRKQELQELVQELNAGDNKSQG